MCSLRIAVVAAVSAAAIVSAQSQDAAKIIADVRAALGGEAELAAVRTLTLTGDRTLMAADGSAGRAMPVDVALELPDKYARRNQLGELNGTPIAQTVGFNGLTPLEVMDAPQPGGGRQMFVRAGSGAQPMSTAARPDAGAREATMAAARRDFARLLLGALGTSTVAFPLEFASVGQAESDGQTADVLAVTGPDGFTGRLFVDVISRLPLLFTWMDKEPLVLGPPRTQMTFSGDLTAEQAADYRRDREERTREAEAKRQIVEYRMFYADYKAFGQVKLPTRLQLMIDGRVTEEVTFDEVEVNPTIDPKRFQGR